MIPSQAPARVVFAARAAVVDFFVNKGLTVPYDAPNWLVTGKKNRHDCNTRFSEMVVG
ncbi:MAG TPA: hypothetical protein VFO25_08090 [Candidatus Eremiobacteraceae bacterium]|nr:hypothetical protein [Candidatus Eremiobacteraceae bacterium]